MRDRDLLLWPYLWLCKSWPLSVLEFVKWVGSQRIHFIHWLCFQVTALPRHCWVSTVFTVITDVVLRLLCINGYSREPPLPVYVFLVMTNIWLRSWMMVQEKCDLYKLEIYGLNQTSFSNVSTSVPFFYPGTFFFYSELLLSMIITKPNLPLLCSGIIVFGGAEWLSLSL